MPQHGDCEHDRYMTLLATRAFKGQTDLSPLHPQSGEESQTPAASSKQLGENGRCLSNAGLGVSLWVLINAPQASGPDD